MLYNLLRLRASKTDFLRRTLKSIVVKNLEAVISQISHFRYNSGDFASFLSEIFDTN